MKYTEKGSVCSAVHSIWYLSFNHLVTFLLCTLVTLKSTFCWREYLWDQKQTANSIAKSQVDETLWGERGWGGGGGCHIVSDDFRGAAPKPPVPASRPPATSMFHLYLTTATSMFHPYPTTASSMDHPYLPTATSMVHPYLTTATYMVHSSS